MNRTVRLADAFTRYQRRHGLTSAGLAAALGTTEDRLPHLRMCRYADPTEPTCTAVVTRFARDARCDADALAVILLEAVEFTHA